MKWKLRRNSFIWWILLRILVLQFHRQTQEVIARHSFCVTVSRCRGNMHQSLHYLSHIFLRKLFMFSIRESKGEGKNFVKILCKLITVQEFSLTTRARRASFLFFSKQMPVDAVPLHLENIFLNSMTGPMHFGLAKTPESKNETNKLLFMGETETELHG